MRVYLTVTIDTECDKGPGWRCQNPLAFQGITRGVGLYLQPLFRMFGAKPTYLLSTEVIEHGPSRDLLASLATEAELGTHLHGELTEPGAFVPEVTSAFQRDYPEDIERAKLAHLTDVFEDAFGSSPRSFRAGRFGVGEHTIPILESLGYTVESSVTPFMDWSQAGAPGLAFMRAPTQPYHPDPRDPGVRGAARILEIPVTIRPRALTGAPFVGRWIEPRWLRPTRGSRRAIVEVARDEIRAARAADPGRPVILTAMFHNVEVLPGTSPYASTETEARAILGRLEALLAFAGKEGIATIGLADVPEVLGA